ncbi:MAG: UvrY/SirA/GacA family response regulator transcription factor [Gammaproteobacteria bacterium]|nr:UvrY/SirA/GacA family response regulator transcription factor [Gammaproteobacteria bacterium]
MIKILLVDDHELVRTGIKRLLTDVQGMKVVGEAETGEEAVKFARDKPVDVILMDAKMPGIGGLEATKRILRHCPDLKIIALTVHGEEPFPSMFLQAGAAGYLTKGTGLDEMVRAIKQVFNGQHYLAPEIAQQMALRQFTGTKEPNPFDSLSEREMQVMMMITAGQKVQDISDKLCLSPKTVNTYRYRLFEKLAVNGDVELTHLAIRHGILDAEQL